MFKVLTANPGGYVRSVVEGERGFAGDDIVVVPHEVLAHDRVTRRLVVDSVSLDSAMRAGRQPLVLSLGSFSLGTLLKLRSWSSEDGRGNSISLSFPAPLNYMSFVWVGVCVFVGCGPHAFILDDDIFTTPPSTYCFTCTGVGMGGSVCAAASPEDDVSYELLPPELGGVSIQCDTVDLPALKLLLKSLLERHTEAGVSFEGEPTGQPPGHTEVFRNGHLLVRGPEVWCIPVVVP